MMSGGRYDKALSCFERMLAPRSASDPGLLAAIRQKLADNCLSTALFDTDRFRRHIESAYMRMWEIAERGESPHGFSVEPIS